MTKATLKIVDGAPPEPQSRPRAPSSLSTRSPRQAFQRDVDRGRLALEAGS